MRIAFSLCLLALSAAVGGQTAEKPSFAGHWVLVQPEDPTAETAVSVTIRQTMVKTAAPGPPMVLGEVTIQRRFSGSQISESYKLGVSGTVSGGPVSGDEPGVPTAARRTETLVGWKENTLSIKSGSYSGATKEAGPFKEHEEQWTIDAQRRLVIEITDRSSDAATKKTVAVYRRASEG